MPNFSQFVTQLHNDTAFRTLFAKSPAQALQEAGFDPTMFVLPTQIDYNQLTQRLNNVFSGSEQVTLNSPSDAANLSANQIWQRFGVIGLTSEASSLIGADDPTDVVAVVIYGSSVAVSNSNTVVAVSGQSIGIQSVEQLQALRQLSKLPQNQLTFGITGPGGVQVQNVKPEVVDAFLKRTSANTGTSTK